MCVSCMASGGDGGGGGGGVLALCGVSGPLRVTLTTEGPSLTPPPLRSLLLDECSEWIAEAAAKGAFSTQTLDQLPEWEEFIGQ